MVLTTPCSAWLFRGFDVFGCYRSPIAAPVGSRVLIGFFIFGLSFMAAVLTYDRTEEDDSSLPHMDGGGYNSRSSVLPPGILPHGMPQVKGNF